MFRALYNLVLLIALILTLPKFLWDAIRHRKYRKSFLEKLGLKIPQFSLPSKGPRLWIHAVSVGEAKAVAPLVKKIQEHLPDIAIVFSATTETGLAEAKRSMPHLNHYFYLPLDFSWAIEELKKRIEPTLLILVESDFWYNLLSLSPHVILVNGKISEGSAARFRLLPFFARKLFEHIDVFCLQSKRYASRFESLGIPASKIVVTGNLKFDQPFPHINIERWKKDLAITPADRILTIGSTHDPEEEQLMEALQPLMNFFPTLKILLVPRHPERFSAVAAMLERKKIPFARFTDHIPKHERVILVDEMGVLSSCYQLSELAIVGGSFVSHVGGHNIFEPAALGVPVLFGPHMESQKDLVDIVLQGGAGKQVTLAEVPDTVLKMLSDPPKAMRQAGIKLAEEVHGATARTWQKIETFLTK